METLDVVEVENAAQLKQFIIFPNELYRDDPNYVTPLYAERKEFFDKKANPFYKAATTRLFLAVRNGQVLGRIATCINYRHNEFHEDQTGFFGFFDTVDDYDVARVLLKVAMITLKKAGMDRMRGPMNFSTNHEVGFLVEGYDSPPVVMMTYNQPYQVELAEKFGLKKSMDLLAYYIEREDGVPERIQKVVDKLRERSKITVRPINMKDFDAELARVKQVYDKGWEKNWGFVPMDEAEFEHMAGNMKQIVDPRIVLIAEHEGEPIGFTLALPNINQALIRLNGKLLPFGLLRLLWHTKVRNKIDSTRLVMFGVVPRFQKRGVDAMMFVEVFRRGEEAGYKWAETSWTLETNELMHRSLMEMGARVYKRYRIMDLPL
ncbi:N-acetyltransferase [candidate division GN15 bacterium]|nr:N-acetyltransferase [candidate division GN15 bacterium]